MGITVGPVTTPQGFEIQALYIRINTFRFLLTQNPSTYHCIFTYEGFKSYQDKVNGCSPVSLPDSIRQTEVVIPTLDFIRYDIFEIGYKALKAALAGTSYTVQDIYEPNAPKGSDYVYDKDGYDVDGYKPDGFDKDGYDRFGYNAQGYDRNGYDRNGYDVDGYNQQGFDQNGYDRDGYDFQGYNQAGVDRDGNPRPTGTGGI
jgi:hypothetical protein